ncbi:AI-2E family transporter [Paenibacillus aquistagni]|uniref:Predicted PurR-regulated permease PerM n=1 Tax=Paenibacillus aquistagni TaxID=1852522 RepID=A0A1X7IV69_9BACL|nr:AI-2E family transporter [Paenibacillus aquistagni]SMG18794.1 Predicted PurR-regulated permease PerM [Paenibacillus aquistagni]
MEWKRLLTSKSLKRFCILALCALLLYSVRSMMNVILLTFIFTFLMGRLHDLVSKQLNRVLHISPKIVLPVLYIFLVAVITLGSYKLFPLIRDQVMQLYHFIVAVYTHPELYQLPGFVVEFMNSIDIGGYIKPGVDFVFKVSHFGINLLVSLILSLFFLLEKTKVTQFSAQFKHSKISWLVEEITYFGQKFVHTFGKVLETQLLIATINCILTTLGLWILGFPQLIGLALIIFVLGLIPVAGVIISLIPLCTIAFSIGGVNYIIYVIIMICIIHAIEAYVLNPKLMSSKTHLPVFYTFLVLLFSEHLFGVWGLIIGIPIFVFLLDVLGVPQQDGQKLKDDQLQPAAKS